MADAEEPRDPFEGLVLDDDFVRGGQYEAPARTRHALSRPPVAHRGESPPPEPRRARRSRRRPFLLLSLVVLLVLGGTLAVVHATGSRHPARTTATAPATSASPAASPSEVELSNDSFLVGGCYTWDQEHARVTADSVPCGAAHLAEAVKHLTLQGYGADAAYPTETGWDAIARKVCTAPATGFLGHPVDPDGRFDVSALRPVPADWKRGDRSIECVFGDNRPGTIANFRGPFAPRLTSFTGDVRGTPQAYAVPAGTCEVTRTLFGSPRALDAPCAGEHSTEYVGSFSLPAGGRHPNDTVYGQLVDDRCNTLATSYAGRAVPQTSTRYVGGDLISAASWADGNRTVNCAVYSVVAGTTRPRDVTGSVRVFT